MQLTTGGGAGQPLRFTSVSASLVTSLRRAGASIPVFSLAGREAPVRPGLLRCCAARRPALAPLAGAAAPRCSSGLLPKSVRWLPRTKSRRAAAGRGLPASLLLRQLAPAGRTSWRSPAPRRFSPFPAHDKDVHFAVDWQAPAGSLPLPQAFVSAAARRAWRRARRVPAGSLLGCDVP